MRAHARERRRGQPSFDDIVPELAVLAGAASGARGQLAEGLAFRLVEWEIALFVGERQLQIDVGRAVLPQRRERRVARLDVHAAPAAIEKMPCERMHGRIARANVDVEPVRLRQHAGEAHVFAVLRVGNHRHQCISSRSATRVCGRWGIPPLTAR